VTRNAQLIGFILAACVPSSISLAGVVLSNRRWANIGSCIDDFRRHMDLRFDQSQAKFDATVRRLTEKWSTDA
jgi:hypothetical protein